MYFHCYLLNLVSLKSAALISCQSIPLSRAPPEKLYFFVLFLRCRWLELFEMVSVFFPQFQLHELTVFFNKGSNRTVSQANSVAQVDAKQPFGFWCVIFR